MTSSSQTPNKKSGGKTRNLTFEDFYRKEFVQALDVQTQALTDNVEATCDILAPVINLLPSLDNDHKEEDVDVICKQRV